MVEISTFGKIGNETVSKYTVDNGEIKLSVLDFGATICELFVPDKNGKYADVVCGYDNIESYMTEDGYLGATVGRYANRIGKGKFSLGGKEYVLYCNNGANHLHGGKVGYSHRMWKLVNKSENSLVFGIRSPDGDEGYPAALDVTVTFTLDGNALCIKYHAAADGLTVVNMTNHSYFNMDGYDSGSALSHKLYIEAGKYDKVGDDLIPVGEPVDVSGTAFDFTKEREIAEGYDHNFVLDKGCGFGFAARLTGKSGRSVEVYTDMPAIQIYTACYLAGKPLKGGVPKVKFGAVCLETQFSPDTPNRPYMPSCEINAGNPFDSETKFVFSAK